MLGFCFFQLSVWWGVSELCCLVDSPFQHSHPQSCIVSHYIMFSHCSLCLWMTCRSSLSFFYIYRERPQRDGHLLPGLACWSLLVLCRFQLWNRSQLKYQIEREWDTITDIPLQHSVVWQRLSTDTYYLVWRNGCQAAIWKQHSSNSLFPPTVLL